MIYFRFFFILGGDKDYPIDQHSAALILSVIVKELPDKVWKTYHSQITAQIFYCLSHKNLQIVIVAIRTFGYLIKYLLLNNLVVPQNLLATLVRVSIFSPHTDHSFTQK